MSTETQAEFIKRKYDVAIKLIDDAIRANALIMPIVTVDGMDQRGLPIIEIKFMINERMLQAFKQNKST